MNALTLFNYQNQDVRTVIIEGEPWFVLADVCRVLEIANPSDTATRLDSDALGTAEVIDVLGRPQQARTVSESGLYEVVFLSRKPEARAFKRWITHEVIPAIRKTGSYSVAAPAPTELSRRDLARMIIAAEDEADRQRERAEVAEGFRDMVERSKGLNTTEFVKAYFPAHKRVEIFDFLYRTSLIINQLNKGPKRDDGTYKDGPQHLHPGHKGKRFFYLASAENKKTGYRTQHARVIPGDPEIALVQHLEKHGFSPLKQFATTLEV